MIRKTLVLTGLALTLSSVPTYAETDKSVIGDGALYAVGVSTPDAAATAAQYQRIFGVVPRIFDKGSNAVPGADRSELKMAGIFFPNFYVKLQQPLNETGPFSPYVRRYGTSIMNFQIHVNDAKAVRTRLEGMGQKWVLGAPDDFWAYVDAKATLGVILEPINIRNKIPVSADPAASLPLGTMPVTHVGIAVKDSRKASRNFSKLFGIALPENSQMTDLRRWNGTRCEKAKRFKVASWKQGDIGIELIETSDKHSIWSQFVQKHGDGAMSIGFDVGDKLDAVSRQLEEAGGKLVYKKADGSRAYFDFLSTLGIVVELDGMSREGRCS